MYSNVQDEKGVYNFISLQFYRFTVLLNAWYSYKWATVALILHGSNFKRVLHIQYLVIKMEVNCSYQRKITLFNGYLSSVIRTSQWN